MAAVMKNADLDEPDDSVPALAEFIDNSQRLRKGSADGYF